MAERAAGGVEQLLESARGRIERLEPEAAWAAAAAGDALIVDIRSDDDRRATGIVPGSVHVPRTVLEWRADPASPWHNPRLGHHGGRLLLLCAHGYSSSLAAATLVDIGLDRAGDVIGGFEEWSRRGLPIVAAPPRRDGELPGMGGPEP